MTDDNIDLDGLDAELEAEAEREAMLALNNGVAPPTRLSSDRIDELKNQRISMDQIKSFVRWRARDRQWPKAAELAGLSESIGWELELDPDVQEDIKFERNRIQSDPATAIAELMPRAIGNLEERLLNNEHNAAETVIKSSTDMMRTQSRTNGKSPSPSPSPSPSTSRSQVAKGRSDSGLNEQEQKRKDEASRDSGALHERRSLNRVVERFRGAEEE